MSFSVACERTGVEWASRGIRSVFAQPANALSPQFVRMLGDILRWNREARALADMGEEKATLGEFLDGTGFSDAFVDRYIVPMGAAIWSADPETFLDFPALRFVQFFANHGLLETRPSTPWRVVRGGSARYVEKLTEPFRDRIRCATPVRAIRRRPRGVDIATEDGIERFDRVVLALHSDQALRLLTDATGLERHILRRIRYQENEVVLHSDASLMPESPHARASWNYRVPEAPNARALVTYDMNRLQRIESKRPFLVTLNPDGRIDPRERIRTFTYHHPIFDREAMEAQQQRAKISGVGTTHYCGAYWGFGFHEDGVRSALAVCDELGLAR